MNIFQSRFLKALTRFQAFQKNIESNGNNNKSRIDQKKESGKNKPAFLILFSAEEYNGK